MQTFGGKRQTYLLPAQLRDALNALSQREGVTLFQTVLAAYATLLHRYTGQTDITVGTPIAGRTRSELAALIGFFVNTLVLRTDLQGNPTFRELLQQVRQTTLDAYAHQDVPFEKLVEVLQPERDLSRAPLFQTLLALQNATTMPREIGGLALDFEEIDNQTSKFDLSLSLRDLDEGLQTIVE
jgi:non-ribosomal peptide synthetase component F